MVAASEFLIRMDGDDLARKVYEGNMYGRGGRPYRRWSDDVDQEARQLLGIPNGSRHKSGMFAVPYWNGSRPDTGHCAIDDPNLHHQNQTLLTINCLKFKLMFVCSLPVYYRLFNVNLYC